MKTNATALAAALGAVALLGAAPAEAAGGLGALKGLSSAAPPDTARASGVAATVDASEPNEGAANLAPRSPLEGDSARHLGGKNNPKFGWRSDLPWGDLKDVLDDPATLKDVGPANFIEECVGYSEWESPGNRTNWDLIDRPSGVCTPDLFCGFDKCDPKPNANNEPIIDRITELAPYSSNIGEAFGFPPATYSSLPPKYRNWIENEADPSYDISRKVLFPRKASDVVAAVKFAGKYGLQVSVKNSGHSYSRSSTKGDTLLLNMRQYMTDMVVITSCDEEDYEKGDPCKLAKARNKPGVLQLRASDNWAEVYIAVNAYNGDQSTDEDKFLITGGAAATVSPGGWTFQGGLSGTAGGRMNGFGADQVVQFEMVLANGKHVKFGPTEWDPVPDCDDCAPKTTKVEGKCNEGGGDEEEWVDCDDETNSFFPKLWKAMRGGAAGYGVVVSTHLQLHPYKQLELVVLCTSPGSPVPSNILEKFLFQAFLDPESVGLTEDESDACSSPNGNLPLYCYGEGSGAKLVEAWKAYLTEAGIDLLKDCNSIVVYDDFATELLERSTLIRDGKTLPPDLPPPQLVGTRFYAVPNLVIPAEWILDNLDEAAELFPSEYSAFGGKGQPKADDGMNAISKAYRDGGTMVFTVGIAAQILGIGLDMDTFWREYFPAMYDTTDPDNFPSVIGSNHYGYDTYGPLKSDWTKDCPVEWSRIKRDEKCISVQEAVWGTKLLRELEEIKDAVDPDGMFTCDKCVGDNKAKKKNMPATSNKPSKNEPASLNSKVSFKDVPESEARNGAAAKGFAWLGAVVCVLWNGWALQW